MPFIRGFIFIDCFLIISDFLFILLNPKTIKILGEKTNETLKSSYILKA